MGGKTSLPGSRSSTTPSPARLERTVIGWIGADLPRTEEKGYATDTLPVSALITTESLRPAALRPELPTLIYFFTAKDDTKLVDFDARVFGDERVGISGRFFNCIRIALDEIRSSSERKVYGGDEPLIIVFETSGKEVKRHSGWEVQGTNLFKTMDATIKSTFGKSLTAILNKEAQILDVLDRTYWDIEDLKVELKEAQDHLTKHDCERGRRNVKEVEEEIAKIEAERAKALEEERNLLNLGSKPKEAASTGN